MHLIEKAGIFNYKNMRLLFASYLLFLFGCTFDKIDDSLVINNNSSDTIVCLIQCDSILEDIPITSKVIIYVDGKPKQVDEHHVIYPETTKKIQFPGSLEEYVLNACKDSTIRVYIFSKSDIDHFKWDSIYSYKLYKKKYDLRHKELVISDWTISYP